jgi:hypothetical protein
VLQAAQFVSANDPPTTREPGPDSDRSVSLFNDSRRVFFFILGLHREQVSPLLEEL